MNGKEKLINFIFGPRVEGVVSDVIKDPVVMDVNHVLVLTDDGELKHMMHKNVDFAVSSNGFKLVTHEFKPGDKYDANIRGKGMLLMPWSKVTKDPFNLNE